MASTAPAVSKDWTYERYLALDDDRRYEILDGELIMTPAPSTLHQQMATELGYQLVGFVKEHNLGRVYYAPTDVVLAPKQVVQPDLLFVRADRVAEVVGERAIQGTPDLVVEIISPSSTHTDHFRKRVLYERFGVPEYWIVDPANRSIEVLTLREEGYELFSFAAESGSVSSHVLPGLSVTLEELLPR
jgi:Uma2 family endonuclease